VVSKDFKCPGCVRITNIDSSSQPSLFDSSTSATVFQQLQQYYQLMKSLILLVTTTFKNQIQTYTIL
jgi:hypothetical protein